MSRCSGEFSKTFRIFFLNDIDVKIYTDPLLNDFGGNYIVFLFFLDLGSGNELGS